MATAVEPSSDGAGLVDLGAVSEWMDVQGLPQGPIEAIEPIGGGTQNVMLRFTRGGKQYVLRRPPQHLRATSNEVLRREIRVLDALSETDVRVPGLVAACPDEAVLDGAVFYLMEPVSGFNVAHTLPALHAGELNVRHQMGLNVVREIARLGELDFERIGLGDYGNPDGFLERQVPRWMSELESYSRYDGYTGPQLPGVDHLAQWLERHRPQQWRPGIMHGDFHLANTMFSFDGPEVAAVVDWEMSTIGDPLLDLGWLLATWPDGSTLDTLTGAFARAGGLATPAELADEYAANSNRDVSALPWYTVLACFKLGIVLEGTHARACAGKAPKATGDLLHAMTLHLFEKARALAE